MGRLNFFALFAIAAAIALTTGTLVASSQAVGNVYVASNAPAGNEILVFERTARGAITPAGSVATGGLGTGAGLGNQSGLVLSDDERFLYVVNAGSDSVSALAVVDDGLELLGTYESGGHRPVSLALDRDLLYVVNAGGMAGSTDAVYGFEIAHDGTLAPIAGSARPLSADLTAPAQVGFSADGAFLLVTEKATNAITVFPVEDDGTLGTGTTQPSVGATPFGFDVDVRGRVYVSEAFGGAPEASTVSVYALDDAGGLDVIDPSVPTTETAACWFALSNDGRFGYTTNTGSGTLTGFSIAPDGTLALLDEDGATAPSEGGPIDFDFTRDGRSVYVLNGAGQALSGYRFDGRDGSLDSIGRIEGLPMGANGLAAR